MGKKQTRDVNTEGVTEPMVADEATAVHESNDVEATSVPSTEVTHHDGVKATLTQILESQPQPDPLMQEVRAFLDHRSVLARKLAEEIAATEKKLAELKRTAAQLFPENQSEPSAKDRKGKKPKPKPVVKAESTVATEG